MRNTISCPKSYENAIANYYSNYRGSVGASRAKAIFDLNDAVVANYNTADFTLEATDGTSYTFEWIVDPTVVTPGNIAINLTGLVTLAQIAAATMAAIAGAGGGAAFGVQADSSDLALGAFIVLQQRAGSQGNTRIFTSGAVNYNINGFNVSDSAVYFYSGQSLLIPLLWGLQRAMGPSTSDTIQGEPSE